MHREVCEKRSESAMIDLDARAGTGGDHQKQEILDAIDVTIKLVK
jgi:hypothetical protein